MEGGIAGGVDGSLSDVFDTEDRRENLANFLSGCKSILDTEPQAYHWPTEVDQHAGEVAEWMVQNLATLFPNINGELPSGDH